MNCALPDDEPEGAAELVSSASAVASAIRKGSNSPVEFVQRIEKAEKSKLVLPSPDFQRLCVEQLDLFRRIVDPNATLSVSFLRLFADKKDGNLKKTKIKVKDTTGLLD